MMRYMQTNGSYKYDSVAGAPGCESVHERDVQERHWRAFGRKLRKEMPTAYGFRRKE